MKSTYKHQIAAAAGVSTKTLHRWLDNNRAKLSRLGVTPHTKLLPPRAVRWICEQYGVEL